MATLKAQNFELEFSYYDLNCCNEIVYALEVKYGGKPFFNPEIMSEYYNEYGKFVFSDCSPDYDWLHAFFVDIVKDRKGGRTGTDEPPNWSFEAITWEDRRPEKEKSWEGKTLAVGQPDGSTTHEPYAEAMKSFIPFWEDNIELKISFPYQYFEPKQYTDWTISFETTFDDLLNFVGEFGEELVKFYKCFAGTITYLGNGKYRETFGHYGLDREMYEIKNRAEWHNLPVDSDEEIVFKQLNGSIENIMRELAQSSIAEDLVKKTFALIETKLEKEKDEKNIRWLTAEKSAIVIVFPQAFTEQQLADALNNVNIKEENVLEETTESSEIKPLSEKEREEREWLFRQTQKYYDEVIALKLQLPKAYLNKGCWLEYLDNNREALECYNNVIALNPDCAKAYNLKGKLLYESKNYQEVVECCDKAIEIYNKDEKYCDKCCNNSANTENIRAYQCKKEDYYDRKNIYYIKGNALFKLGNYLQAVECYKKELSETQ